MAKKFHSQIEDLHLSSDKYVLALPGWYPTLQDAFLGDFNQRHVKAAGLQTPQVVLYIVKDQRETLTETEVRYHQLTENIVEITVMYPKKKNRWIDVIHSNLLYLVLLYKYANLIKKRWGLPIIIHSYIVIRGGLGGWLLGKKWRLPFILSENWTIYYRADPGYLAKRDVLFNWTVRKVFKNVKIFLPVTNDLKHRVNSLIGSVPATIVPNVVETELFFLKAFKPPKKMFRFIHVSTMSYQKNPEGLLRCFKRFSKIHPQTCLWLVGPYSEEIVNYVDSLELNNQQVFFTGPVSYQKVAEYLQDLDAFVLYSRYENLPCVILEALCCGVPVISTSVGGIPEVINASNGILIENENDEQLISALVQMFTKYHHFHRPQIANEAKNIYSYTAVGRLINAVYSSVS